MRKLIATILIFSIIISSSMSVHAMGADNVRIISNGYTSFYIESNGNVKGWGQNTNGEVGYGNKINQLIPITIPELSNVRDIICGKNGSLAFYAINTDGTVYALGDNGYGQLGIGNWIDQSLPIIIPNLTDVSQIVTNGYTVYAITVDGCIYAWGKNDYGQVGNNSTTTQKTPVKLSSLSNIVNITCTENVAYAINDNGNVYSWGRGNKGQIGNNKYITTQKIPVQVIGLSDVDSIITNGNTTFALCQDGKYVYGWGDNNFGEIGCYNLSRQLKPTLVSKISNVKELVLAQYTTYAILKDETLYGWGRNGYGQLANGGSFDDYYPHVIPGIPKIKQVISNGYSTCVLGTDNSVYTWGRNLVGEVGNGKTDTQRTAYKISNLNNIAKIDGGNHTLFAIDNEGNIFGWGQNTQAQLGIGTTAIQRTPIAIPNLSGIEDIEKVENTVFAKDSQGTIYGWGANSYGQLGNDTTETILSPIVIFQNYLATTTGTGDVSSVVPIVGLINALTISITHPANISYTVNPNNEDGFYCADIQIQNNSKVPIRVTIESFKSSTEGKLYFENVLPESIDWDDLSIKDSKKYISLGLQYVTPNDWMFLNKAFLNPVYALELDNSYIGALVKGKKGSLKLSARYGVAFDQYYTAKHDLVLIFSLV